MVLARKVPFAEDILTVLETNTHMRSCMILYDQPKSDRYTARPRRDNYSPTEARHTSVHQRYPQMWGHRSCP